MMFPLESKMSSGNCVRQKLSHLEALESESIHILRVVAAEATNNILAAPKRRMAAKNAKGAK